MAGAVVDAAYRVSEHGQYEKVDGVLLDLQTARAIIAVHQALAPANRHVLEEMDVERAGRLAWKAIGRSKK